MKDVSNPVDLIRRGQAAARVGRLAEAKAYLRKAVKEEPASVDAWLALAGVEDDTSAKRSCFEQVLALDPDNVEAALGLEYLGQEPSDDRDVSLTADDLELVIDQASRRLEQAVGPPPPDEVPLDDMALYCANHPNVETVLRCNRCSKPICTRCAVRTPVGYRCKECVGQQQSVFYTGGVGDYVIAGGISLILGGIAAYLMVLIGGWFFALILGPTLGVGIAEAVRLAVRRRRSRYLWLAVGAGMVLGAGPSLLLGLSSLWALVALGLFLLLGVGAATARLR